MLNFGKHGPLELQNLSVETNFYTIQELRYFRGSASEL